MRLIFTIIIYGIFSGALAQSSADPDSLAYQNQRKKINSMLAQRSLKFGQYQQSLSKHTGIFGLQTKKDIRRSGDILMDIIRTDNAILEQTKVLLSLKNNQLTYRIYQQQTVQSKAAENQDVSLSYMVTINKLRNQNEKLSVAVKKSEGDAQALRMWGAVILVVIIGLILFYTRRLRPNKA